MILELCDIPKACAQLKDKAGWNNVPWLLHLDLGMCRKVTEHPEEPRQGAWVFLQNGLFSHEAVVWSLAEPALCMNRFACQPPGEWSGQPQLNRSLSFLGIRHSQKA